MNFLSDDDDDFDEEALLPPKFHNVLARCKEIQDRSCTHGGPPPSGNKTVEVLIPRMIECCMLLGQAEMNILQRHANDSTRMEDLTSERVRAKTQVMIEFWLLTPGYCSTIIDDSYPRLCFSIATDATLDGNLEYARNFLQIGIFLNAVAEKGRDKVLKHFRGEEHCADVSAFCGKALHRTRTDRGMILFLDKVTPCACLNELGAAARSTPKAGKCSYCKTQDIKIKLKKCSRCQMAEYCSRECQKADWPVHKREDCFERKS